MLSETESKSSEFEQEGVNPARALQLTPLKGASGGTCNAYTARLFGKKVFVKEIKPEVSGDARMLAAFKKEAEIGFRLDHRNIPKYIFAEGILSSERYIVQEFIDGLTLPEFIKGNPAFFQNKKNVERFIREFVDVIDYLHHNQVIHLDLKPENILISRVGNSLKLVDLGFCASDFYDDTRGFSPSELAPEGSNEPRERGFESDYYGIGKILTYIRTHTPGFPRYNFRKIENLLLLTDPLKRLTSKEGIEKHLGKSIGKGGMWAMAFSTLIIVALFIILYRSGNQTEQDARVDEKTEAQTLPEVEDRETNTIENSPNTHHVKEDRIPSEEQKSGLTHTSEFPYATYEKLKGEMTDNINENFAGYERMLEEYIREGKYTAEDFKTIRESFRTALHKTFDTKEYKSRYKNLSPSLIDDTMAELVEEMGKNTWDASYKKYVREYQASVSTSSQ